MAWENAGMIKKKIWELKEEIIGTRGRYM